MKVKKYSLNEKFSTDGSGLWSDKRKTVKCIAYSVPYISEDNDFGELRIYFDTKTWNVNEDGLIYTDRRFLKQVCEHFGTDDIDYSEQGMQGNDFVSFDVGSEFLMMAD